MCGSFGNCGIGFNGAHGTGKRVKLHLRCFGNERKNGNREKSGGTLNTPEITTKPKVFKNAPKSIQNRNKESFIYAGLRMLVAGLEPVEKVCEAFI